LDEVSEFALFRAIVETGGISAAALALQSSPAAVSRRLSALESKLGVRLAERSSRRFRLTDEGLLLYERCRSILDQIRDAEAEVASRGGAARGLLRIGAPADFGRKHIAPLLPAFTVQHPGLDAHLILSDIGLENESDGCDLVFRFGLPSDPTMIARKIATTTQVVCAAPSYVARRGAPNSPDELHGHDCLRLARRHHLIDRWRFTKDGSDFEVHVAGHLSSGDGSVLRSWALSGEGISWEAYWDVADDLTAGRLTELLPEYRCSLIELYAVFAPSKPVPPRIRLFVDYMLHRMKQFAKEESAAAAPGKETAGPD